MWNFLSLGLYDVGLGFAKSSLSILSGGGIWRWTSHWWGLGHWLFFQPHPHRAAQVTSVTNTQSTGELGTLAHLLLFHKLVDSTVEFWFDTFIK